MTKLPLKLYISTAVFYQFRSKFSITSDFFLLQKKFTELPFRKMLSCAAVWAMLTSYCAYSFVINTMKMYLPQYWKEVMLFDISSNGIYSALPYIVQTIFKYISSIFVDVLREKLGIRGSILSRLFNSICIFLF